MADLEDRRGVLFPGRLPVFAREAAPPRLADRVRWCWVPRWDLPPGEVSRQHLLPFPSANLVVGPDGVELAGPTTRASHVDLEGTGWVVGALLRPAGLAALHPRPRELRDTTVPVAAPDLQRDVAAAMARPDEDAGRRGAVAVLLAWAEEHLPAPDEVGRLANALEDVVAADRGLVRVDQLARHLGVSTRAVQRAAERCIGLPPLAVIRRYRLQEAAQRLREEPGTTVAQVAADLGYADQAHLAHDFRTVLGRTARDYRSTSRAARADGEPLPPP
ncbi:helix-turn-helix domain-containing protein [uncultured Pseudokineococcus sp.]|uniref:AraC family transcriptional regulator n=1 Tax=uncultured Pseudokineococcus sp. TaxID=1642928 RepID=UPI0026251015|nr:helix-turn-helix domain-containing protein [uncultured Pseudokineococcus sp.]